MIATALLLTVVIFAVDLLNSFDGAVAVLYTAVILLLAPRGRRFVIFAGAGTTLLTLVAFLAGHVENFSEGALSRLGMSLFAILITTALSLRDRASRTSLGEQARILELSHDTVIIRDADDVIQYWNDGAEQLYGWTRSEAVGKTCEKLLHCHYPLAEVTQALDTAGQWSGEIRRMRRDGTELVLESRWLRRRDPDGRAVGVIETSTDLTRQRETQARMEASESRYRTIFETAGFAAWESDWSEPMRLLTEALPPGEEPLPWLLSHPKVVRDALDRGKLLIANQAAVDLFGAPSREALGSQLLISQFSTNSEDAIARAAASLLESTRAKEVEARIDTLDGRKADVLLRASLLPGDVDFSHVLVMALDVTERNEARARIEQVSAELAHAARVSLLGQLAASIAHEVNQPLTAIINYGKSANRWLRRPEPDIAEAEASIEKLISNATRAAEIVNRVRGLARKVAPKTEPVRLLELVEEAMALVQREARMELVDIRLEGAQEFPLVIIDRVQVQQVIVNLLLNGVQAMRGIDGRQKELCIRLSHLQDGMIQVAVEDTGTGFPPSEELRLFEPFFTTKSEGMGMGLSICRSIIENQGGRISARNNDGFGATVAFTLPTEALPLPQEMPATHT